MKTRRRIAIVGGEKGRFDVRVDGVDIDHFGSQRQTGNGELARFKAALRARGFDLVVQLTSFIGHSMDGGVAHAAKNLGVDVRRCSGGKSGAQRLILQWLQEIGPIQ